MNTVMKDFALPIVAFFAGVSIGIAGTTMAGNQEPRSAARGNGMMTERLGYPPIPRPRPGETTLAKGDRLPAPTGQMCLRIRETERELDRAFAMRDGEVATDLSGVELAVKIAGLHMRRSGYIRAWADANDVVPNIAAYDGTNPFPC